MRLRIGIGMARMSILCHRRSSSASFIIYGNALDPATATIFAKADRAGHTARMGELLTSRHYPNLKLKTLIFPEETHYTVVFGLVAHGLRYVFQAG